MRQRFFFLFVVAILCGAMATGCISGTSTEQPATTTPAPDTFFLAVTGEEITTREVGLSEIQSLPYLHITATMVKKTGATEETAWGGALFYDLMDHLGIENIASVVLVALDGYEKEVEYNQLQEALLAWEDGEGVALATETGGPIRFVAPGLPSNTWMQNLIEVRVILREADSFYLAVGIEGDTATQVGLSEIQSLPNQHITATLTKKTGETEETEWGGAYLVDLMAHLGLTGVQTVRIVASDGYEKTIDYAELQEALLAWEDGEGVALTEETGGPIRFIAPGLSSSSWIQNLAEIWVTV
ncbi:MAG: molybdopterin-dependent oxidoreductase [Candidatus Methanofastidiosa archaeon]|nr:molybdopterin-dependent oxidoreductase [Candidatus Methanofastidiosa archaeon]